MKPGRVAFYLVGFLIAASMATSQQLGPPQGLVSDFAHVLSPERAAALEQELRTYEKQTSRQVTVVTVPSLEGLPIQDYALRLWGEWKIGDRERDNGVLFLIAPREHRLRIQAGYGAEADLTDLECHVIIEEVEGLFHEGKMEDGIALGVHRIIEALGSENEAPAVSISGDRWFKNLLFALIAVCFLWALVVYFLRGDRPRRSASRPEKRASRARRSGTTPGRHEDQYPAAPDNGSLFEPVIPVVDYTSPASVDTGSGWDGFQGGDTGGGGADGSWTD